MVTDSKRLIPTLILVGLFLIITGTLFVHVNSSYAKPEIAQPTEIVANTQFIGVVNDKAAVMSEQTAMQILDEIQAAEEEQARIAAEEEAARLAAEAEKQNFIDEWTPRLNRYLSGSPLSGYGETFATAAYEYGIDPRYSAAISCIESGKGAHCFRAHNAWGWGSSGWSSWEEAIYAHAHGLAAGYGYTVSQSAAQKYCPPNWSSWYSNVSSEMSKI